MTAPDELGRANGTRLKWRDAIWGQIKMPNTPRIGDNSDVRLPHLAVESEE